MATTQTQFSPDLAALLDELPTWTRVRVGSYDHALLAASVVLQYYHGGKIVAARLEVTETGPDERSASYQVIAVGDTFREVMGELAHLSDADREALLIDYIEPLDAPFVPDLDTEPSS